MDKGEALEWFSPRLPFSFFVLREEGKRTAAVIAAFCFAGCLLGGLMLAWERGDPVIVVHMLFIAGVLVFLVALVLAAVFLGLWLLGYGYSYRLGPHTLAYRFVGGKGEPPVFPDPDERRDGAWLGGTCGLGGWASWEWLRGHAVRAEPVAERNLVVLRSAAREKWYGRKAPAIYLFCRDRARFAAVLSFVGEKLAEPAGGANMPTKDS